MVESRGISLPRHKAVSGRKLRGVKAKTWLVASVQVRRLHFLCSDGSHNERTHCCSLPLLLTLLPLLYFRLLPVRNIIDLGSLQPLAGLLSTPFQRPINRTKWLLKMETPFFASFFLALHGLAHTHTHTAPTLRGFNN